MPLPSAVTPAAVPRHLTEQLLSAARSAELGWQTVGARISDFLASSSCTAHMTIFHPSVSFPCPAPWPTGNVDLAAIPPPLMERVFMIFLSCICHCTKPS